MTQENTTLTVDEVAEQLKISRFTVVRLFVSGKLPGFKAGGQWRIWKKDFEEYTRPRERASGAV